MAQQEGTAVVDADASQHPSRRRAALITVQLSGVNFTTSAINGLVTVGLPTLTASLDIPKSLAFWPASVSGLATASTLLLFGSIADAVGPRWVTIIGSFTCGATMIGAAVSQTAVQLITMRAIMGIGLAMHFSSSVPLITTSLAQGKGRNLAFSCLGLSQPLGFSFGLVIGGVLIDSLGWRSGWYIHGGVTVFLSLIGFWVLPRSGSYAESRARLKTLGTGVDWVGALLGSAFMATICYFLAVLSSKAQNIRTVAAITCLCFAVVCSVAFVFWMHFQVKAGRPALIPNNLWRNVAFPSICAAIVLSYAVMNSMELFTSLFYQQVQHVSALQASIRILPSLIVGVGLNLTVGLYVHKVPAVYMITMSSVICAVSPLLMATIRPERSYWAGAFIAQILQPVSADALFTVGLIIITDLFPAETHALAGAVFNTAGQFGVALGLAILQIISSTVIDQQHSKPTSQALLEGYKASFWTMFGFMLLCGAIGAFGFRNIGKIGLKKD